MPVGTERPRQRRPSSPALVALVTAIVALITGVVGLIFEFWPDLKPLARERISAEIDMLASEYNVSYSDFVRRFPATVTSAAGPGRDANDFGNVYYLRVKVEGFRREDTELRWDVYVVASETCEGCSMCVTCERAQPWRKYKARAPYDQAILAEWVPSCGRHAQFLARFRLRGNDGVLLALVDTEPYWEGGPPPSPQNPCPGAQ